MSDRASISLALVAEAAADREIAAVLADRVFRAEIPWLRDDPGLDRKLYLISVRWTPPAATRGKHTESESARCRTG